MVDTAVPSASRRSRKPGTSSAAKAVAKPKRDPVVATKPVIAAKAVVSEGPPVVAPVAAEPLPEVVEAASPVLEIVNEQIETMTDQAGVVAAEAIEPVADAAAATIEIIEETAPQPKASLEASPFFNTMKGMTMATAFDTTKAKEMFSGMNEKAKGAMEKSAKLAEDFQELAKGNVEAMVASGRVAAKGVEEMAQYGADYGRKTVEQATTAMKSLAGIKSPTELFQLQSEYAKSAVDSMVAETSKFTESYIKLLGDIAQPLTSRYAVAAEKIKAVTA